MLTPKISEHFDPTDRFESGGRSLLRLWFPIIHRQNMREMPTERLYVIPPGYRSRVSKAPCQSQKLGATCFPRRTTFKTVYKPPAGNRRKHRFGT